MLFCFNRLKSVLKGSVDSLQSKMKELILLLIFALVSQPVKGNWKCLENYSRTFFNTETKGWELSIRRGVRKESSFAVGCKLYKFLPSIWINWKPSDRYYCLRPNSQVARKLASASLLCKHTVTLCFIFQLNRWKRKPTSDTTSLSINYPVKTVLRYSRTSSYRHL